MRGGRGGCSGEEEREGGRLDLPQRGLGWPWAVLKLSPLILQMLLSPETPTMWPIVTPLGSELLGVPSWGLHFLGSAWLAET